ncbi:Predicted RNA binding protein YcfA, dsRBD-like fold, HicA-like mRNA interferase family [Methylobacterium sp. 174MFSha1.1]|uniref:type II toxin-antitoxin system HicA family toxin n=1 Tax=Methylobacterium sp. 174MFSha1.1 TaxID=1502749 RepID=UPI0008E4D45A|nr:type II toxin-antitoxin system HicA family toxin [Methylobacterium sp. 174MFSha1.1]SFU53895.1 Predicted RNA binding protein YcfA, dsRBD-like fold, HicA-like mRNA interferase family [Methylobacterium sp. 174MFSha1.1]
MSRRSRSNKARDVLGALRVDGWQLVRKGPGDHLQFRHPMKPGKVTVDTGEPEIPSGTLRSIYRQAGWEW